MEWLSYCVGKVTEEKLAKLGAQTVGDLRKLDLRTLESEFGRLSSLGSV